MRLTILTVGSVGDVLPLCRLGAALAGRGHCVRVATYAVYAEEVARHGLAFTAVPGDPRRVATKVRAIMGTDSVAGWLRATLLRRRLIAGMGLRLAAPMVEACADADLVVFNSTAGIGGSIAEARGVPSLHVAFMPMTASRALAAPGWPAVLDLSWLNRFGHWLMAAIRNEPYRAAVNALRRQLGLRPLGVGHLYRRLDEVRQGTFYAFSPVAVPRPADWGADVEVGGGLLAEPGEMEVPPVLARFMEAGSAPVYFGLGSMLVDPAVTEAVLAMVDRLGVRLVLQQGWAGLGEGVVRPDVLVLPTAPHRWLFPRCACVVHHGGCSTMGTALAAGRPQVIVPQQADQPFWGLRMAALGVAPTPVYSLSNDELLSAVHAALQSTAMGERARMLARVVTAEDGIIAACRMAEKLFEEASVSVVKSR